MSATLVTAIMPTRGRSDFARRALAAFHAQTYPNKQIVIADDCDDPSFLIAPCDSIYFRLACRWNIPQKRNMCCARAEGDIIIHWDSDDWSAPERIADQVERLESSGKAVTGYDSILFNEPRTGRWGRYYLPYADFGFGTSLCYRREFWRENQFNDQLAIGEDGDFCKRAYVSGQFIKANGDRFMVARAHPGNTSAKDMGNTLPIEPDMIPVGFAA